MQIIRKQFFLLTAMMFLLLAPVTADTMKQDNVHVHTWNAFASNILKLHEAMIEGKQVRTESKPGGYAGNKDFYIEKQYFLGDKLISIIQWEKENPDTMHTIEFFIHDDQGRVVRDYAAAYLPAYRNAPTQTLVSLHQYNGKLHAFRSFDASGFRVIERCSGSFRGKQVELLLDEDEIADADGDPNGIMATAEYQACFKGLPAKAGKYLTPQ